MQKKKKNQYNIQLSQRVNRIDTSKFETNGYNAMRNNLKSVSSSVSFFC